MSIRDVYVFGLYWFATNNRNANFWAVQKLWVRFACFLRNADMNWLTEQMQMLNWRLLSQKEPIQCVRSITSLFHFSGYEPGAQPYHPAAAGLFLLIPVLVLCAFLICILRLSRCLAAAASPPVKLCTQSFLSDIPGKPIWLLSAGISASWLLGYLYLACVLESVKKGKYILTMMLLSFNFKIDPASLSMLSLRGENYIE